MVHPSRPALRADAARNRSTILAAAIDVLARRPDAGLAEVARASGLTRTTVYAHFRNREELLEEMLRTAVADTVAAIDNADPTAGPADEALRRVLETSWREVAARARLIELAHTLGERMVDLHAPVFHRLAALLRRGQAEGVFRRDIPERWLLTTYFTLVHAAGREVAVGAMTPDDAEHALISTLLAAYSRAPRTGSPPATSAP
jgi:AcrR family transcriptional regulator